MPKDRGPDYAKRSPQVIRKNKKRVRQLEWQDTRRPAWVAWVSGLCLIIIVVSLILLSFSDRVSKPMNINGDQLGPIDVQGQQYEDAARAELAGMTGEQPRWALMSTQSPWTMPELAEVLRNFDGRVSTLYFGPGSQWEIPEPSTGHTRLDTLMDAAELWAKRAQSPVEDITVSSVLVFGTPAQLQDLGSRAVVEPAPVGATYGRIGIRPVMERQAA